MICSKCGAQVRDGVQFCPDCGAKMGAAPADEQDAKRPAKQVQTYQEQAQAYGTAGRKLGNGFKSLAIVGILCGIAGIVLDFFVLPLGIILGVADIALSGLAIARSNGGSKGLAIIGLVCGIAAIVVGLILCFSGGVDVAGGSAASAGLTE